MLTEVDTALTQTGTVQNFTMMIEPHQDLTKEITVTLGAGTWYYGFIDVPAGYTNLSILPRTCRQIPCHHCSFI